MEQDEFEVNGTDVGVTPDMITGDPLEEFGEGEAKNESELWECAPGSPEEWLKSWDGRQKTHDMFHRSYE
ncbi:hypothetical protein [Paenibacillus wynnii]|uniref:Uncharacterized protein n=1 Tax=Paenibacillus wynnii TaxID=268407 RepID=A0A098MBJ2_9BACL|nr:hypothetical protein [Paenibacillus wynnii]KGE19423.1 hypothetical protein PWYN_08775 [Paenibacillus wynnii]